MNRTIPMEFLARETDRPLALAFDRPVPGGVMSAMMDRAMNPKQPPPAGEVLLSQGVSWPCSAYVNIPFCPSVCSFCGFFKTPADAAIEDHYIEALTREIEKEGALLAEKDSRLAAVFLGGGTPTFLSAGNLDRLLKTIQTLPLAPDCEITVEGRLSTFNEAKLAVIWKRGVSRLSIGVQSFNAEVRRRAGRSDSPEKIILALSSLQDAGGPLLVIDLMYGLPGQSLDIFKKDLELATDLALPALSAYMLKLMPRSPLAADVQKGLAPPPDAAILSEYYQVAEGTLAGRGYFQTSGNHWRLDERDRNVYNTLALARRDILAWGAGAGGSVGGAAFANTGSIAKYVKEIGVGQKPLSFYQPAPAHHRILNEASRHLHSGGIDFDLWPEEWSLALDLARPLLEQWQRAGLLVIGERRAALNQAGLFWRGNLEFALRSWLALNLGDRP